MNKKISHTTPGSDLLPRIEGRIQTIRGLRVMIDADLATRVRQPKAKKWSVRQLNQQLGRVNLDFL